MMDVITIESSAFEQIMDKLLGLEERFLDLEGKALVKLSERWLDTDEMVELLGVSRRTLQEYRVHEKLPYSQIGKKMYYRAVDVERFLKKNYQSVSNF